MLTRLLDSFPLNAGSMLVRSHPRAIEFLNHVRRYHDHQREAFPDRLISEQDCIREILLPDTAPAEAEPLPDSKRFATIAKWIPQKKINAFPEDIPCWDKEQKGWESGDLVVHFAGAFAHVKEEAAKGDEVGWLMRKYKDKTIW